MIRPWLTKGTSLSVPERDLKNKSKAYAAGQTSLGGTESLLARIEEPSPFTLAVLVAELVAAERRQELAGLGGPVCSGLNTACQTISKQNYVIKCQRISKIICTSACTKR